MPHNIIETIISTAFSPHRPYREIEANHLLKIKKLKKKKIRALPSLCLYFGFTTFAQRSLIQCLDMRTHPLHSLRIVPVVPELLGLSSSTGISWKTFSDMSVLHKLFCYLCCGINGADTLQPLLSGQQVPVKQQLVCHLSDHSVSDKTITQRRHDMPLENTFFPLPRH